MLEVAQKYLQLKSGEYYKCFGKVDKVVGLTIESIGPKAKLNDLCMIFLDKERKDYVMSEVVGFKDSHIILMPFDNVEGVGVGCIVENTGHPLTVAVGDELLGHTVDGIGRVTDCDEKDLKLDSEYPIEAPPPDPMSREIISDVLPLGVKAVDGLITVGKGQRIGIFAGSGVGKSTLLGMFARNTKADINVIALIGERGREVREFIERDLGPEGMARSVVVVATSDKPALIRNKAAKTATSIAEYFRDKGEDVLLMMDSLTRFSMAQREIGLASGEPPVTRGYPPSVYSEMPKLLERAGRADKGSITGLYTVLVDGDDFNEPITDTKKTKKEKKMEEKAAKKAAKKAKKNHEADKPDAENDDSDSVSSKIVMVLVTILIIAIWLGIFAVFVKADVGGFGSTVLAPALKDVPVLSKILPDSGNITASESTETAGYTNLDDAVSRIKELEKQLDDANSKNQADAQTINDLNAQIQDLSTYKEEQAAFEEEKEKYYEEVVFSDKAPDIKEYKKFYEQVDPANAEILYKQVCEQLEQDDEIKDYAQTYSKMKPKEAAAIFDSMTDNLSLVAKILNAMDAQSRGNILGKMDSATAAKVTKIMNPSQN